MIKQDTSVDIQQFYNDNTVPQLKDPLKQRYSVTSKGKAESSMRRRTRNRDFNGRLEKELIVGKCNKSTDFPPNELHKGDYLNVYKLLSTHQFHLIVTYRDAYNVEEGRIPHLPTSAQQQRQKQAAGQEEQNISAIVVVF